MDWPLYWRLPVKSEVNSDTILDRFLDYVASKDLSLYPAQEEAILELLAGKNVILNTPTGSGKSLVALALHFQSLAQGRRSIYTCPIKALVNEKFRDLCAAFGPDQVGMITGDGGVNQSAPIICCTAEILSNMALRDGEAAAVDDVIMDEFHYYSDRQRGVAWQVPLLILKNTRFMLMSATLGEMDFFAKAMTDLNKKETAWVSSQERPVPLTFEYRETPLHETVSDLISKGLNPIYLVNFSQREAAEEAQNLLSVDFSTKEDKQKISAAIEGVSFKSPYGKELQKLLKHGIGLHHAGLLPRYRVLVEKLAQQGLLKVVSGTDTLGVGVNVPIRTVLFTKLCKYDGEKSSILSVRDFHQISGRAGRRGFDTEGLVVAQAPEHVIENLKMKLKAASDPKKAKKMVLKNPPPFGFVMWTRETFNKLIQSKPEPLVSRFQVSHSMLLNVLSRDEDGCKAMRSLIRKSHGTQTQKRQVQKLAFAYFRSLYERKIIEVVPPPIKKLRVHVDLQEDFSLNHSLSLYLLDTIKLLKVDDPNYAVDLLTLVESILESPDLILRKQLDRLKSEKMFELKMAGVEYEERIAELEKLEHPKPNRDFIYSTFNTFSDAHPWVGQENIRPKSVAREMFETFQSFDEYIRDYELQRVEGILLRYLSEVFKVLEQTVPDSAKTDEVQAMSVYFGAMLRQTDSSLLEDWERMRQSSVTGFSTESLKAKSSSSERSESSVIKDITLNKKAFTMALKNEIFSFIKLLAKKDYTGASDLLAYFEGEEPARWTAKNLEFSFIEFYQEHRGILTDPSARAAHSTSVKAVVNQWQVQQILTDPEGLNDWCLNFEIDIDRSRREQRPWLSLISIQEVSAEV